MTGPDLGRRDTQAFQVDHRCRLLALFRRQVLGVEVGDDTGHHGPESSTEDVLKEEVNRHRGVALWLAARRFVADAARVGADAVAVG